jgi:hypothetical protein
MPTSCLVVLKVLEGDCGAPGRHRAVMEDSIMKTDTKLSRRRLLARIPAVAAAAVPAAAVALPGLATAVPGHLDGQQVRGLAEMLNKLEKLPDDEARTVLTAITDAIECSMRNHEHDAPLLALKPKFDAAFEDWWARTEDSKQGLGRYPARTDEEIDEWADGLADLTDEVMAHQPITREGLAMQCRAMIMDGHGAWDDHDRCQTHRQPRALFRLEASKHAGGRVAHLGARLGR